MAKKSQAIAVLEGRLNLLKMEEAETKRTLEKVASLTRTLEDLLKSIRAAAAGSKGGRGRRGNKNGVPIRQAVTGSVNKQAVEAAAAVRKQINDVEKEKAEAEEAALAACS